MASTTPSPNSSPSAVPPASGGVLSPPPPSSLSSATPPSPLISSQPNQTSSSPSPSSPSDPSAPPPSPPQTVPVTTPPPSPPQTVPVTTPPPSPSLSPPPPSTTPPPTLPPPSPPASPTPPVVSSPPAPTTTAPPPAETSPSLPTLSPPPPAAVSPPPQSSEALPSPPISSPPPPTDVPRPPSTNPPPAPQAKPPKSSPSTPSHASPPLVSQSPPPPSIVVPPPSTLPSIPSTNVPPPSVLPSTPSVPSGSSPPASLPRPPTNETVTGSPTVSLPSIPTEKPTARPTIDGTGNRGTNNSPSRSGGLNTGGAVAIGLVVGFVVLSILVMAVWFVQKKKKEKRPRAGYAVPSPFTSSHNSGTLFLKPQSPANFIGSASGSDYVYSPSEPGGVSGSRSWFTYEELIQATNGFSEHNLLGEGGFGCVYKGMLIDGREVAVKQLKIGGGQGEREFRAEVETISRVHHRHLVSMVGYCISEHQRLLVYDYVINNTLHYHLHEENIPVLDWPTRVKIAAGAARGIAYLHEDCHPRIIHRDIKSSNILLDNNFEALVSDFGLAKLTLDSYTHVTTRVMGTFGYMAPEYATSGKLTDKSDVYSYGVVLLELITGRKPVDASQPIGDESLVEWARPLLIEALESEDFETLVDPRLEKNYNKVEMFRMIEAAAACVRHSSVKRPRMSQVVRAFDSMDDISDLNNGMKPGESSIFNSAQQSAQIRMFRRMAFGSQDSSSIFNESQSTWRSRDQDSTTSTMFPQNKSGSWNV